MTGEPEPTVDPASASVEEEEAEARRRRRRRAWLFVIVFGLAVIVAIWLIYLVSYAAFGPWVTGGSQSAPPAASPVPPESGSASPDSSTDAPDSGRQPLPSSIELSNDRAGEAVFDATNLTPGSTGSADVTVVFTGSQPGQVRLFADHDEAAPQELADHLELTISAAPTGPGSPWTGSLADFHAFDDYASGILPLSMADGDRRVYTISYRVLETAGMNVSADVTFIWEAQG